jgi:hypothetical protein
LIDRYPLDTRQHAQAWLDDHLRREAVRERRAIWAVRLKVAAAVIGAISAAAALPLVQAWFGMF